MDRHDKRESAKLKNMKDKLYQEKLSRDK